MEDPIAASDNINNNNNSNNNNNADDDVDSMQEQAEAMAEVTAQEGYQNVQDRNNNNTNRVADEAVMGINNDNVIAYENIDESGKLVQQRFMEFLNSFTEEITVDRAEDDGEEEEQHITIHPYVQQADAMAKRQMQQKSIMLSDDNDNDNEDEEKVSIFANTLFLDFTHVLQDDDELAEAIQSDFCRFEPYLRQAIASFVIELHPELDDPASSSNNQNAQNEMYFIAVHNLPNVYPVRNLKTLSIGRLNSMSGTVTRTSEVRPELLLGSFRCNNCGLLATNIPQQFHYTRPVLCRNPRCSNAKQASPIQFTLEVQSSVFTDWQKLRVQENSDEIPPGSMPRTVDVMVRNEMVERAKAGDKCIFTGTMVVIPDGSALARAGETPKATGGRRNDNNTNGGVQGLKALGVRELTYRTCFLASCVLPTDALQRVASSSKKTTSSLTIASLLFGNKLSNNQEETAQDIVMDLSRAERDEIRIMKSTPRLYDLLADSIAPSTFGHREVKKGLLLMLLGGVHKTTTDGIQLRGDINVCIVGDPSTAKSQFLKYIHSFLPSRAVYTSGKASSSAGLTAAVQRDQDTGEYCIEAGALMLADNGICCIDEFDKMDPHDQVAIHEAMEQQTISITKAGIQATLNARASVLAAANPIYGRYDRTKTLKANVALSAPILSRFDLFFVVLDECNPDADRQVAEHILKVHRCEDEEGAVQPPFTKEQMQRYIRFARAIHPKITVDSQRVLVDCYRKLRQGDTLGRSRTAYRITVRQLESMIRLSEALARLHCDLEIQPSYVLEAFRLLKTSIIQVETNDVDVEDDDDDDDDDDDNDQGGGMDIDREESANDKDDPESQNPESQETGPETQLPVYPGEYIGESVPAEAAAVPPADAAEETDEMTTKKKKKTKKTKITFEEYEAITNAIASHLRTLEDEKNIHLQWKDIVEWYLEQMEHDIGTSIELLEETRKKVNLVIKRLLTKEMILIAMGTPPTNKKQEQETTLAVHPNYVIS